MYMCLSVQDVLFSLVSESCGLSKHKLFLLHMKMLFMLSWCLERGRQELLPLIQTMERIRGKERLTVFDTGTTEVFHIMMNTANTCSQAVYENHSKHSYTISLTNSLQIYTVGIFSREFIEKKQHWVCIKTLIIINSNSNSRCS